jgi:eukaryotic-like serine/threonine-protein kinase
VEAQIGGYRILGRIGRGGMSNVWLGRREESEHFVCLKTLRSEYANEHNHQLMFFDEVEIASRLEHSNLVKSIESKQNGAASYLVMEYVFGETLDVLLRHAIKIQSPLPPLGVAAIVTATCEALDYAHALKGKDGEPLNLIHRDVSPENIIVSDTGVPKLVDFGVIKARERHQNTTVGGLKGKLSYLAPEQIANEPVDHRADIYALGVVLYSCLANLRPFEGVTLESLYEAKVDKALPPLATVDPLLSKIADIALSRRPSDRFETAGQMATALRVCLEGQDERELIKHLLEDRFGNRLAKKRRALADLAGGGTLTIELSKALQIDLVDTREIPTGDRPDSLPTFPFPRLESDLSQGFDAETTGTAIAADVKRDEAWDRKATRQLAKDELVEFMPPPGTDWRALVTAPEPIAQTLPPPPPPPPEAAKPTTKTKRPLRPLLSQPTATFLLGMALGFLVGVMVRDLLARL